ncbi:MAG: peptide-methionine (S)-S-oxide reductase [Parvularculaceae bacterium]|nr:peptide-methionine (S)-S-oxide reductase [Parvularculaceae bacterium]
MQLGLGGGCHWCTEAVVRTLRGTDEVVQGFIASQPPDNALSEAVQLTLDEGQLPLSVLLDVHLRTHASRSEHSMRLKYRSAVYVGSAEDGARVEGVLAKLAQAFPKPLVTKVLPFVTFQPSDELYQRYHEKRPTAPFCRTHIDPKLSLLREQYAERLI